MSSPRGHGRRDPGAFALGSQAYVPPYHIALAHAGLGDTDAAFALLTKAATDRDPALVNVGVDPRSRSGAIAATPC